MNEKSQLTQGDNAPGSAPPAYTEATGGQYQGGYPGPPPQGYSQPPTGYPQQEYGPPPPGAYPPQQGYGPPQPMYPPQDGYNKQGYPPQQGAYPPYQQGQTVIVTQQPQQVYQPIKSYLGLAILSMFFFWPTGIVAIIKANEARSLHSRGNHAMAKASNKSAKTFAIISIVVGLICIIVGVVFVFIHIAVFSHHYNSININDSNDDFKKEFDKEWKEREKTMDDMKKDFLKDLDNKDWWKKKDWNWD